MEEYREALVKQEERNKNNSYEESCSGCNIRKLKHSNPGIPFKHLFFVFVVCLSAGTPFVLLLLLSSFNFSLRGFFFFFCSFFSPSRFSITSYHLFPLNAIHLLLFSSQDHGKLIFRYIVIFYFSLVSLRYSILLN